MLFATNGGLLFVHHVKNMQEKTTHIVAGSNVQSDKAEQ
jgi:hypothetical protein